MKFCKACGQHKELSEFTKDKDRKDGLCSTCKDCRNGAQRTNAAKRRLIKPVATERRCPRCKLVKPRNEFNACATRVDGMTVYCKVCASIKWQSQKEGQRQRSRRRENWPYQLWNLAKQRAKAKGLEFTITPDDIVIPERCPILGVVLERNTGYGPSPRSPSLDRIEATKGYVSGNVAVISYRANAIKSDANAAEHRLVADWIDRNVTGT